MPYLLNPIFISILIDVLPALILLCPCIIIGQRTTCGYKKVSGILLLILFAGMLLSIFSITGLPRLGDFSLNVDLILTPFQNFSTIFIQYVLNVFLFLPVGFLPPVIWQHFSKFCPTLCYGFGLSLMIELLQLLNNRCTDINDLMMNTLGTIIGYLLARVFLSLTGLSSRKQAESQGRQIGECLVLSCAVLAVWIFITPFSSRLL